MPRRPKKKPSGVRRNKQCRSHTFPKPKPTQRARRKLQTQRCHQLVTLAQSQIVAKFFQKKRRMEDMSHKSMPNVEQTITSHYHQVVSGKQIEVWALFWWSSYWWLPIQNLVMQKICKPWKQKSKVLQQATPLRIPQLRSPWQGCPNTKQKAGLTTNTCT